MILSLFPLPRILTAQELLDLGLRRYLVELVHILHGTRMCANMIRLPEVIMRCCWQSDHAVPIGKPTDRKQNRSLDTWSVLKDLAKIRKAIHAAGAD